MTAPIPHSRPWITPSDRRAVEAALSSGMVARGAACLAFEREVAANCASAEAIACASGTEALTLALRALDLGPDAEVIVPTYVCRNVLYAVQGAGAKPRICDVDPSGTLTAEAARAAMNSRTRAIVAVHVFGHPCDIDALLALGVPVVEDACQALGLRVRERPAGSLGSLGVLSFHATKCLTTGEGGMLLASDTDLIRRARRASGRCDAAEATGYAVMSDLQAALGCEQLARYPEFVTRRRKILELYRSTVARLADAEPGFPSTADFLFRCTVRTPLGFVDVQDRFLGRGVHVRRGVDELLHRHCGLDDAAFPVATRLFNTTVSVPFYPSLSDTEVERVASAMVEVFGGH